MERKVLLVIFETFSEFEICVLASIVKRKYKIETVSINTEKIVGESGLLFSSHILFDDIRVEDYDAIIIPGGDMFYIKDADNLFSLVKRFYDAKKLVAAICSGPFVLSKAGILEHHPFTVTLTKEQRRFLSIPENHFIYKEVVKEENIITAQGHAFVEFGIEVARHLNCLNQDFDIDFYTGKRNKFMELESKIIK
ncbi:DJ-1/PfpI family protein [Neobacillus sp. D3-1R]|uniref:DJ-1/PfpI family protein n=1 Tax=Neobacillus sp. D3-1R TaxID=3445778 RepID=UPI003F9FA242